MSFTIIFSQSVCFLFILLTLSFTEQTFLILMKSSLPILSFRDYAFGVISRKPSPNQGHLSRQGVEGKEAFCSSKTRLLLVSLLSCVWLFCDLVDCSLPGSSVQGIFRATILEWVAISFSRGSFWSRDQTCISFSRKLKLSPLLIRYFFSIVR